MMEFAERLKSLIAESEKKIADIATDLGIAQQTLYSYISGKTTAEYGSLIMLADYFKCSLDYMVGRTESDAEGKETVFKECPPFSERLKEVFSRYKTSESKICKKVLISRSRFYGWLFGGIEPSLPNLIKLADFFDCSIDFLVGRER